MLSLQKSEFSIYIFTLNLLYLILLYILQKIFEEKTEYERYNFPGKEKLYNNYENINKNKP